MNRFGLPGGGGPKWLKIAVLRPKGDEGPKPWVIESSNGRTTTILWIVSIVMEFGGEILRSGARARDT